MAASVGDGSVRIWESSTLEDDDTKLNAGHVTTYWQNVQGKVLVVAWHPTWENVVAFATAESRVSKVILLTLFDVHFAVLCYMFFFKFRYIK